MRMEISTKGIFKMVKRMDMAFVSLPKETGMKVIGKTTSNMDKGLKPIKMAPNIMGILKKARKMGMGQFSSLMELNTMATVRTIVFLDLV